jgi:hypothetical protein
MINGIWYTRQFKNITSPPNKNKLLSTSMHTTLESYLGFRSITNYEEDEVDLDMEMVLTLGMMEI